MNLEPPLLSTSWIPYEFSLLIPLNNRTDCFVTFDSQCKTQYEYLLQNTSLFSPEDYVEAYAWWSVAATNGDERAKKNLPEAKADLTPEQLAAAEHRATELTEQINANKAK